MRRGVRMLVRTGLCLLLSPGIWCDGARDVLADCSLHQQVRNSRAEAARMCAAAQLCCRQLCAACRRGGYSSSAIRYIN